jgi:hypothetical protein
MAMGKGIGWNRCQGKGKPPKIGGAMLRMKVGLSFRRLLLTGG